MIVDRPEGKLVQDYTDGVLARQRATARLDRWPLLEKNARIVAFFRGGGDGTSGQRLGWIAGRCWGRTHRETRSPGLPTLPCASAGQAQLTQVGNGPTG